MSRPDSVQSAVDADLTACRRGPATLDAALAPLTREDLDTRYRGLLARVEMRAALRAHTAATSAVRAEMAEERRALLKGGNR